MLFFIGSAKDFHLYDWYLSFKKVCNDDVHIITDNIKSEGYSSFSYSKITKLFIIDNFLFTFESSFTNKFRNFVKFVVIPLQILLVRRFFKNISTKPLVFAHSTYYGFLMSFTNVNYCFIPQGSEVLVRPFNSKLYSLFLKRACSKSSLISVDSTNMKNILNEFGFKAVVTQNGIDTHFLINHFNNNSDFIFSSIRGITPNYRISEIVKQIEFNDLKLNICSPFVDESYFNEFIDSKSINNHGKLSKSDFYIFLSRSKFVLSIPVSDSSPKSVYEAIFLGCILLVSDNNFLSLLPTSMASRVFVVNPENHNWLFDFLEKYKNYDFGDFIPCEDAINIFDRYKNSISLIDKYKKVINYDL